MEVFSAQYNRQTTNTVSFWSEASSLKDYSFSGKMGVTFLEASHLDLAYIRSNELSPCWDKAMVVAARSSIADPELALLALREVRQASSEEVGRVKNTQCTRISKATLKLDGSSCAPVVQKYFTENTGKPNVRLCKFG